MQFLLLKAGTDSFALDAFAVRQIHKPVTVTRLPYVPDYVAGLVNIEGEVMPQIDLRKLLRLPSTETGELLVVNADGYLLALLVDRAFEKVVVEQEQINEFSHDVSATGDEAGSEECIADNPDSDTQGVADYIHSELMIDGKTWLILSVDKLARLIKPEAMKSSEVGITARKQRHASGINRNEDKSGYLTFRLGKEVLAMPLQQIMEVIEIDYFTHIPGAPVFITGLAVLRSQPLLVVNAAHLLKLQDDRENSIKQVLIVQYQNFLLGLLVDEVYGIQYFSLSQVIRETSSVSFVDAYVIDANEQIILLLNLQSLFTSRYTKTIEQYLPRIEMSSANSRKIETIKMLKILLGSENFAIPVKHVQRIAEYKKFAHIEENTRGIIGTVDIDGNIIPVVNISSKLNVGKESRLEQWVVITYEDEQWALCVNKATALFDLDVQSIDYSSSGRESIKGIANYKGELISILDFAWLKPKAGNES